ncbi:MAG TPA: ABC transporter ATP-binding protein [Candidatus Dormibacteraeota bacterium]
MIAVEGLRKRYGRRVALDQVDFAVPQGEIFGFLGPNGAGKTTTIRILATLTPPDSGTATIGGVRIDREPFAVRRLIGYMPDFFGVYDRLTVVEYLDFYASCYDVPARRRRRVASELLELVDLSARAGDQVDTLSRGMKQRLCLARALIHNPQVLLLDEPASGLDPRARMEMQELIRELRRMGKTILVSSHIVPEVEELCTWIGVIDGGRIVEIGPKADVLRRAAVGRRLRIELVDADEAATARARALIAAWPGVLGVEDGAPGLEAAVDAGLPAHRLLRELIQAGFDVGAFTPVELDLSDVFLRLTEQPEEARR